jgi:hypothetical protein
MINNKEEKEEEVKKPDEKSGILVQGFFKIIDVKTGKVILQGRS